jgi:hypothetical protein
MNGYSMHRWSLQLPLAESDISTNACLQSCILFQTWPSQCNTSSAPCDKRGNSQCIPQGASSTTGSSIICSFCFSSSFKVVTNQVFCGSCRLVLHLCHSGQNYWTEMHPKFEELLIPCVLVTTPTLDRTCQDLSPACHDVVSTWCWVLNKQLQGICRSCPARQNSVDSVSKGYR